MNDPSPSFDEVLTQLLEMLREAVEALPTLATDDPYNRESIGVILHDADQLLRGAMDAPEPAEQIHEAQELRDALLEWLR